MCPIKPLAEDQTFPLLLGVCHCHTLRVMNKHEAADE